jgi:hypothetical protein
LVANLRCLGHRCREALATAGLALTLFWTGAASSQTVAPSPSFDAVRTRLELGGPLFVFIDYEDQIAQIGRDVSKMISDLVADDPALAIFRQDYAAILDELGLSGIKAVGMSSTRRGATYHNRVFLHAPEPRRGLLASFGGPAGPFAAAALAPQDTDLLMEHELDIKAITDAFTTVAKRFVPDAGIDMAGAAIAAQTGMQAGDVIDMVANLRGRFSLVLRLGDIAMPDPTRLEEWGLGLAQKADLLLRAEGIGRRLLPMIRDIRELVPMTIAGRRAFRASETVPVLGQNQPVLVFDDDTVLLASSALFAEQSLTRGDRALAQAPGFRQALTEIGLDRGNSILYGTPRLVRMLRSAVLAGAEMAAASADEPAMGPVLQSVINRLPDASKPFASVAANQPDGILMRSNDSLSLRSALLPLSLFNPDVIGPIALAAIPAAVQAYADSMAESRAAEIAKENLAIIGEAALAYFETNTSATEVTYADLKSELAGRLKRVKGMDFTDFVLERGFGNVEIELPNGETVTWNAPIGEAEREKIRANLRQFDRAAAWYFRKYPRESLMLGGEAVEEGSPMRQMPPQIRGERYEDLQIRRTDTEIEIQVNDQVIAIRRDPALQRQQQQRQQPSQPRPPQRGG